MKKIAIIALHLGYGGGESAVCNLSNMLCDNYVIEIASVYKLLDEVPFPIDKKIHIKYLSGLKPNSKEFLSYIKKFNIFMAFKEGIKSIKILFLRKYLVKKYIKNSDADIIISTRYLFNKLLGSNKKQGIITIAQEHRHHNNDNKYINKLVKSLKNIDYFMPVSQELTNFYSSKVKCNCVYIPHSLDQLAYSNQKYKYGKEVIAVGRLSKEKGFLDLVEIINISTKTMPDILLHIFGEGNEFETINKKILEYGLSKNIILHGFQSKENIRKVMKNCSLYLMTSHSESFGLVLIEAMAYKLPCIAFDSAKGATEIISDSFNGFLISNRDKMLYSSKIEEFLKNKNVAQNMSDNAFTSSKEYSFEKIKQKNIDFFKKITK